jgi:DNA-binding transcriptional MerR regulator
VTRRRSPNIGTTGQLTIGALAAATGMSIETIRTWERRYGFPRAERKPSGHRVYPLETVARLRRVGEALARGHRAAEVVPASESELDALLASIPLPPEKLPRVSVASAVAAADPADWLDAARAFDTERLRRGLGAEWARLGPLDFVERRAAPFLVAVGDAWADGTIDVRHEHFASAVLGDFLRVARMPIEERATGPVAALTTLSGELHGLGLQLAAVVFAQAGWRPLLLGVNTPVAQIVSLADETRLGAVAVSCVNPPGPGRANSISAGLRTLRRKLPKRLPLIVGGAAAPAIHQPNVDVLRDLGALNHWLSVAR